VSRESASHGCLPELRLRAERPGWVVVDGRAAEFERDVPFGLIVDALNDHIGALEPALLRALDDDALSSPQSSRPLSRQAAEVAPRGRRLRATGFSIRPGTGLSRAGSPTGSRREKSTLRSPRRCSQRRRSEITAPPPRQARRPIHARCSRLWSRGLDDLLLELERVRVRVGEHCHEQAVRPHGRRGDSCDGGQKRSAPVEACSERTRWSPASPNSKRAPEVQKSQLRAAMHEVRSRRGQLTRCVSRRLPAPEARSPWEGIRWSLSLPLRGQPGRGRCPRRLG
jgi:hypothetical protein